MENNNEQVQIAVAPNEKDVLETSMQNKLTSMQLKSNEKQNEIGFALFGLETWMEKKLSNLRSSNSAKCCIYKVPSRIQKDKEHCYRPSIISIGPIFCEDPQLQTMQELKWIYLQSFLQDSDNACPDLGAYINIVRELEFDIRGCYQQQVKLSSEHNFIEMIVLDAIFLVQLFIESCYPIIGSMRANLPPKNLRILDLFGRLDLFMLENQLPFFVLQRIFGLAYPDEPATTLIDIARKLICTISIPGNNQVQIAELSEPSNIEHLLDLYLKCFWLPNESSKLCKVLSEPSKMEQVVGSLWKCFRLPNLGKQKEISDWCGLPKTAKELSAAGIKFKKSDNSNLLCITFDSKKGELHIPYLSVDENTEAILRNILHFEQCHYLFDNKTYLSDFFFFIDSLIDTPEDVHILQQNGILENILGSDEKAANLFNNMTTDIFTLHVHFTDVSEQLNAYANRSWNRWMAILRRDYFNHPWAIISFIFVITLFVLTILQTITSFIK